MIPLQDLRIRSTTRLIAPESLKAELPLSPAAADTVRAGRVAVESILMQRDRRLLAVVGPCSIHDPEGALEYARRLAALRQELCETVEIQMRVYFAKPRTTIGWKGLINDPFLDGTHSMGAGLTIARRLLLEINALGLPAATEFLDPIVPQYIAELVSWAAIGARTTESQTHREMSSGLSMPVGFKNGTDGDCQTAIDAMGTARAPHSFLGIDQQGRTAVVHTTGNAFGHLVLRGGRSRPNFDPESIAAAARDLEGAGLRPVLMVDCSHANSSKKHTQQEVVWHSVLAQRRATTPEAPGPIIGVMLESYLACGAQAMPGAGQPLTYGVSITDACIGWEETETLLRAAAAKPL